MQARIIEVHKGEFDGVAFEILCDTGDWELSRMFPFYDGPGGEDTALVSKRILNEIALFQHYGYDVLVKV